MSSGADAADDAAMSSPEVLAAMARSLKEAFARKAAERAGDGNAEARAAGMAAASGDWQLYTWIAQDIAELSARLRNMPKRETCNNAELAERNNVERKLRLLERNLNKVDITTKYGEAYKAAGGQ
jgi:hypothetical protein